MAAAMPDSIPWSLLANPLARAEDAVARLDDRLAKSPIRDGWVARTHYSDAVDSMWLDGELVHLEDLVLHDAHMDVRTPTAEITRAHAVLRARRRVSASDPDWAASPVGLDALRGRGAGTRLAEQGIEAAGETNSEAEDPGDLYDLDWDEDAASNELRKELSAIDAVVAQSRVTLARAGARFVVRDPLLYDSDWDEDARLSEWRAQVERTQYLPPVLAAAISLDAWDQIDPLQHASWLGRILAAALLRQRGKTRSHMLCVNSGLRAIPREKRRSLRRENRLSSFADAIAAAAERGMQDHDRWVLARRQLERKLSGRRSTSSLPRLIDFVMSRPVVSAGMIARELSITARAAQDLVGELGLRETTGRGRYRAWGVI